MRHCLRLLRSMCSTEDEAILQDLSDQGAISQITSECYKISIRLLLLLCIIIFDYFR